MNLCIDNISRTVCILILAITFSVTETYAQANNTAAFYNSVIDLPTETLYSRANAYRQSEHTIDSALVCYNVLSNRIEACRDNASRKLCIIALDEMAYIHYFHFFDYPQAFAHLAQAEELAKKWGIEVPEIPLFYGLMHGSISQQSNDTRSASIAIDYLREAFREAQVQNDGHNANLAYTNLVTLAFTTGTIDSIADVHGQFVKFSQHNNDNHYYSNFNKKLFEALEAVQGENYKSALDTFDTIIEMTPDDEKYSRYKVGTLQYKAIVNEKKGDYASAIDCLEEGIKISRHYNLKDAQVELYRQLADDASKLQRHEDKYLYQNEYLVLKDSVLNYQQIASIDEVKLLSEMKKAEAEMQEIEAQRKRLQIYMVLGTAILVIVLGWFYALYVKNRQLRKREKSLYQKNVEIIKAEENERKLRNRFQQELLDLRQRLADADKVAKEEEDSRVKYKGSNLKDKEKETLMDRIREVMENNTDIYSVNFSAERLAAILDTNYKYVSQTINEMYGNNFNTLLNNYRIREACRRIIDQDTYGNYTLEALSQSVGFKSRSTFVLQFKKITGLTPSQYQAEARKDVYDI